MSTLPTGLDRFIPVKADRGRVSLCFIEEEGPDTYLAHDIAHTREGEHWRLAKGLLPQVAPGRGLAGGGDEGARPCAAAL